MAYKNVTCPKCGSDVKTVDVVMNTDINEKYRRKRCVNCGRDFFTIEHTVEADVSFLDNWHRFHRDTNRVRNRRTKE